MEDESNKSESTTTSDHVPPSKQQNASGQPFNLGVVFAIIALLIAAGAMYFAASSDSDGNDEVLSQVNEIAEKVDEIAQAQDFSVTDAVKVDQFQAVFLTDGQIYFGQLSDGEPGQLRLENIYYLQIGEEEQAGITTTADLDNLDGNQISLAKLGNELHGPEDVMHINPENILFWENLKNDSQVTTAIRDFENGQ